MSEKVVVGMSGGVDSSVAAYLLKKKGYDVIGVTMQTLDSGCKEFRGEGGFEAAIKDAENICRTLEIPHYVVDFRDIFRKRVIDNFINEYIEGRTPNPCIVCNHFVKWEALLQKAKELGADLTATGHYAKITRLDNGRYTLENADFAAKDQTYALYRLSQEQLSHTLMPVGEYDKDTIRRIAGEQGIPVANKPDSEEICFVSDDDYAGFLERNAGDRIPGPGLFVDKNGTVLGENKGITHYTIGQRKGLGLAMGHPVFVTDIDPVTNTVTIGENEDTFTESLVCKDINYMSIAGLEPGQTMEVQGKIRYGHRSVPCTIEKTGENEITARFREKVRAVTPGQAAVFYEDGHIVCGGTICSSGSGKHI